MSGSSSTIRMRPISVVLYLRKKNGEGAALARRAFDGDAPVVAGDDVLDHGEPDAGAFDARGVSLGAADKFLKDVVLLGARDAEAMVANANGHVVPGRFQIQPDGA